MPKIIIEPTEVIPEVYTWEIEFHVQAGMRRLVKRVRTPGVRDAIVIAQQELDWDKIEWKGDSITARLVDAFRDNGFPQRKCHRNSCRTVFRGAGVYCSLTCAASDA